MSIQIKTIRFLRRLLYRLSKESGQRFNQFNRLLLRKTIGIHSSDKDITNITDRHSSNDWKDLQPVWVLSTGRTGTNTMMELFRLSPLADAFHEPSPELFQFSYDYYMGDLPRDEALKVLMYARDEAVFRSFRDGLIYLETNNRLAYIADLLLELYPNSRFMFVYRNPYDFIRSGMRRNYYGDHLRDSTRVRPKPTSPFYREWEDLSRLEKTAWYWAAVNSLCIDFMEKLPEAQKMSCSSEQFFAADPSLIWRMFEFIGSDRYFPPASEIERVMGTRHNAQQDGSFARPDDWTDEQVSRVDRIIDRIAQKLSYELITEHTTGINMHAE